MKLTLFTQTNIVEGITAAIIYPLLLYYVRFVLLVDRFVAMAGCWFATWICRKVSVNVYQSYLKEFDGSDKSYSVITPSWR